MKCVVKWTCMALCMVAMVMAKKIKQNSRASLFYDNLAFGITPWKWSLGESLAPFCFLLKFVSGTFKIHFFTYGKKMSLENVIFPLKSGITNTMLVLPVFSPICFFALIWAYGFTYCYLRYTCPLTPVILYLGTGVWILANRSGVE